MDVWAEARTPQAGAKARLFSRRRERGVKTPRSLRISAGVVGHAHEIGRSLLEGQTLHEGAIAQATGWVQLEQRRARMGMAVRHSGQIFVSGAGGGASGFLNRASMAFMGRTMAK